LKQQERRYDVNERRRRRRKKERREGAEERKKKGEKEILPVFINLTVHARFVLFLLPVFGRGNRAQKKPKTFCETKSGNSLRMFQRYLLGLLLTASSIPAR
jgi:hypothetical protein